MGLKLNIYQLQMSFEKNGLHTVLTLVVYNFCRPKWQMNNSHFFVLFLHFWYIRLSCNCHFSTGIVLFLQSTETQWAKVSL